MAGQAAPVYSLTQNFMETQNSIVGWTALVFALIALVLAWVAFNRSGADIEAIIQEEAERRTAEFQTNFDALEADLRAQMAEQLDNAADDVATDEEDAATTTE